MRPRKKCALTHHQASAMHCEMQMKRTKSYKHRHRNASHFGTPLLYMCDTGTAIR